MRTLVILAAYNGEKYIEEQLQSILLQNDVDLDVMVFDDASRDTTESIVQNLSVDSRIKWFKNSTRSGSAANNFFNAIKEISDEIFKSYDYIALSDQDDVWLPEKLSAAITKLQVEQASLYGSNLILWDEEANTQSLITKSHPQQKYDYLFESGSAGCTYVFTTAFCLELKKCIIATNYLDWKFFSHDWFIYFFARANKYKVVLDANAYIKYRMHSSNLHGFLNKNTLSASLERLKVVRMGWYQEHIKGFEKMLPHNSVEKHIYQRYVHNYFSRIFVVIQYNFKLNRSFKKSIQFFIISFLPLLKK
jgi:rhamnosyltransferase